MSIENFACRWHHSFAHSSGNYVRRVIFNNDLSMAVTAIHYSFAHIFAERDKLRELRRLMIKILCVFKLAVQSQKMNCKQM